MLSSVITTPKAIEEYRPVVGDERVNELKELAQPLQGAKVLHIHATAFGGGVAEILSSLVPLMSDLGLVADWQVIQGADEFFKITKAMHNSLQGMFVPWTPEMLQTWLYYNQMNADDLFGADFDFIMIHDPQPAAIPYLIAKRGAAAKHGKWVWRCHIDLTQAQVDIWDFLRPFLEVYDSTIFTLKDYIKPDLESPRAFVVPPSIDPLTPKNFQLAPQAVNAILRQYGVDPDLPMVLQVSRFDPWKDPLGVIDAYRMVKKEIPELQLVMVASMANDDPEGWLYYERTVRHAGEDFDIHILSNLNGVGNVEVNAFQTAAKVVIQKSIREGFGLTVTEGLWKGKPVVGGNCGGIPLQIIHDRTGYLVATVEECAEKTLYLLKHPEKAEQLGRAGREHVRQNFLITRQLRDYLSIFRTLANAG
jgi:trehalose synthase